MKVIRVCITCCRRMFVHIAYVITHMALSWVYDGCSDDSDAFKGNAATADGIKNMVNLMDIDAYLPFHRNTDI